MISRDSFQISWDSMGFHEILLGFIGIPWDVVGFYGISEDHLGLIGITNNWNQVPPSGNIRN